MGPRGITRALKVALRLTFLQVLRELDRLLGRGEAEFGEEVALGFGQFGALAVGAGRAGEGADVEFVEVVP